ncbi:glycosyl hydrolase, partial [Actinosynnema sp.]
MRGPRRLLAVALVALTAAVALTAPAGAAATKKGVSVNNHPGVAGALANVRAGWYYTWAVDTQGVSTPPGVEFVPMAWGSGSVTDAALGKAKSLGSTLLGFNEPDMAGQANLSVEQALNLWPRLQATGMRLGAPAVAYGGDQAGGWLDRFM